MYKRTAIRQYFIQYLKDNTELFDDRIYPLLAAQLQNEINPRAEITTRDETILTNTTTHTERELKLEIVTKCINTQNDMLIDFDSTIEETMFEIEKAMSKMLGCVDKSPFALFTDIKLESTEIKTNTESEIVLGYALLKYSIIYDYELPLEETILTDFDVDESLSYLNITNIKD